MRVRTQLFSILVCALIALPLSAQDFAASLSSLEEVPAIISTNAGGTFTAMLTAGRDIDYTLDYDGTAGNVAQAHIHIAQEGVNGAIVLFLCTNLGNGPAGTQACPATGPISGTLTKEDVLTVVGQGLDGFKRANLDRVIFALKRNAAYVNVHTDKFPGGEIRGQIAD
jgi:hypothetical protein